MRMANIEKWLVVGPESGLRRIEQTSGGPVVHYIDATEQQVEVVTSPDHDTAIADAEKNTHRWGFLDGVDAVRAIIVEQKLWMEDPYADKDLLAAVDALRLERSEDDG